MPPVFKALTSITAWILFITGCLTILTALPVPFVGTAGHWQLLAVGIVSLILSLVAIKFRRTLN
jgi:hypothetical protein